MLIRQFVEASVSGTFLLYILLIRQIRPKFSQLICLQSDAAFHRMTMFVVVSIVIEFILASVTYKFLRYHGFTPLLTLNGLICTYYRTFFAATCTTVLYYWMLQHSHLGTDMTFAFRWLIDDRAQWTCGLSWRPPE